MVSKLQAVMKEVGRLSDALDIDAEEFGQRAMRTSILSTSYKGTKDAVDKSKIQYRRALSLKAGIAVAQVFETLPESSQGELPFDEFIDRTTSAYMRITGMAVADRYTRNTEIKGIVTAKMERSKDLGQISVFPKEGKRFVKIYPEVGSTTFAMLMNPETMLRSPYVKAMAQTIGGMAIVDGEPEKFTKSELSETVQDRLQSRNLLKVTKTPAWFNALNVDPFHQRNKVPFYSEVDDHLIILPTFPGTGVPAQTSRLPAIVSPELAFQMVDDYSAISDLVNGFNPPLITLRSGNTELFFNRQHPYIEDLEELLGTSMSKYLPKVDVVFSDLDQLQSRLGLQYGDGRDVARFIDEILQHEIKESDLTPPLRKRVIGLLHFRLGYLTRSPEGTYSVKDEAARSTLKTLKSLIDVVNPTGKVVAGMVTGREP